MKSIKYVVLPLIVITFLGAAVVAAKSPKATVFGLGGGSLVWQDLFGAPQSNEIPSSDGITASDGVVYVAAGADSDWIVRAYDADNGTVVWNDQFDAAFFGASNVAVDGDKVFATGWIFFRPSVRAYDARTGQPLWQRSVLDAFGLFDSSVVHDNTVVAAGGNNSWLVYAYDTDNGTLKWSDRLGVGGSNRATGIAEQGGRVFVGGRARLPNSSLNWFVRAYDAASGNVIWEDYAPAGLFSQVQSIAVSSNTVIAVGRVTDIDGTDWRIRAYDANNGSLLWEEVVDKNGVEFPTGAQDVAVRGSQAFAVGSGGSGCNAFDPTSGNCDFIIRAYEIRSGRLLWEDQLDRSPFDEATSVTVSDAGVFVTGYGGNDCDAGDQTNCDILFRGYKRNTGQLIWDEQVDTIGTSEFGIGITSLDGKVFGSGFVNDSNRFADLLIRAYRFEVEK